MQHIEDRSADRDEGFVWEALDRAHRTLDQVQAWGQLGFWDLHLASKEVYWSTQVFEILGLDALSLDAFVDRVHVDDRPMVLEVAQRAREQAGPYRLEHRYQRGDDSRVLSHRVQSVAGADGTPERVIGVVTDVSHVRALESELEASIGVRNVGLAAGSMIHDFKNQLAIILGHCKLALDAVDGGRAPMREGLEAIQRAATQGVDLTRQVLDLGRVPTGAARPVPAAPILERVAALTRPIVGRGNAITVSVDDGASPVLADADRLEHVLVDLVVNASDAIRRRGGRIELCFSETAIDDESAEITPGRYGRFRVVDDGDGMDETTLRQATQPFFTTKPKGEGSGVGLHAAEGFARASGGGMRISSEPGVGTTVELLLPVAGRRPPATAPAVRVAVLVDEPAQRQRLVALLRDDSIQAVVAADVADVRRFVDTEPIDAVAVAADQRDALTEVPVPVVVVDIGREADVPARVRSRVPGRR